MNGLPLPASSLLDFVPKACPDPWPAQQIEQDTIVDMKKGQWQGGAQAKGRHQIQQSCKTIHCKKFLLNSWIFFDQTFLGLRKIYAEQGIMPDFWSHLKKRFFLS
jgi:hypothetical protein